MRFNIIYLTRLASYIQYHDNFIFGRRLGTLNSARVVLLAGLALSSRGRRDAPAEVNSHSKFSVIFNKTNILKLAMPDQTLHIIILYAQQLFLILK